MKFVVILFAALFSLQVLAQDEKSDGKYIPFKFVKIPAGTFMMGSPKSEVERKGDETQHLVTLTHDFEMQVTPVTQLQWYNTMKGTTYTVLSTVFRQPRNCPQTIMDLESQRICPNHPVEFVNWYDVVYFANVYSKQNNLEPCYEFTPIGGYYRTKPTYECKGYRLPTEAEWEYAARAGQSTAYFFDDSSTDLKRFAIFALNNPGQEIGYHLPAEVGSLQPNPWGLYDMYGNVYQWTNDVYGPYDLNAHVDPIGVSENKDRRVTRGGSFLEYPRDLRSASRIPIYPDTFSSSIGFRLVRTLKPEEAK